MNSKTIDCLSKLTIERVEGMSHIDDILCPRCSYGVEIEYDIWDNSYWYCYHCGLASYQIVTYSNNTTN